jgi:hypothetical protein
MVPAAHFAVLTPLMRGRICSSLARPARTRALQGALQHEDGDEQAAREQDHPRKQADEKETERVHAKALRGRKLATRRDGRARDINDPQPGGARPRSRRPRPCRRHDAGSILKARSGVAGVAAVLQ